MHRETDFDDLTGSSLMRLADRSDASLLRVLSMLLGVAWSLAFIAVGCGSRLQMYGDGSIFSYAIAAEQAWAFHWHNISGRIFVFLIAHWPAELYVRASGDTNAGIALHGLLFFSAPLAGLVATWKADLSECRTIFHHACVSTAVICPLVFGFPTEMWVAHAVFWPTLALAHAALETFTRRALLAAGLTALVLSHGGGVVLGGFIVVSTVLARPRHSFKHPLWSSVIVALTVWAAVLLAFRPDPYIAKVINTAAFSFIDLRNLIDPVVLVIIAAVTGYAVTATACSWMLQLRSSSAVALVAALLALVIYYVHFDTALLADARYPLRTALLVIPPLLAAPAILGMVETGRNFPRIGRLVALSRRLISPRHLAAALLLAATVHTVETAKFVRVWSNYKQALAILAMGDASDAALGNSDFVSSARISDGLNRASWSSTTHFLSILVAPRLTPARLVVSPYPAYRWLSCRTATDSHLHSTAVPQTTREFILAYACSH